jgi:hypothetical protein
MRPLERRVRPVVGDDRDVLIALDLEIVREAGVAPVSCRRARYRVLQRSAAGESRGCRVAVLPTAREGAKSASLVAFDKLNRHWTGGARQVLRRDRNGVMSGRRGAAVGQSKITQRAANNDQGDNECSNCLESAGHVHLLLCQMRRTRSWRCAACDSECVDQNAKLKKRLAAQSASERLDVSALAGMFKCIPG